MNKAEKDDAAVVAFITAICPEAPELYMAAFNEMKAIRDATNLIRELKADLVAISAKLLDYEQGLTQQLALDRIAELGAEVERLKSDAAGRSLYRGEPDIGYTFSQTETIDRGASQEATINRGSFAKYADWESDDE